MMSSAAENANPDDTIKATPISADPNLSNVRLGNEYEIYDHPKYKLPHPSNADKQLQKITPEDLQKHLSWRQQEGLSIAPNQKI